MSEKYQPPTEFIEGLGIDFVRPPIAPFYDDTYMRHQLDRALGYAAHVSGSERVHIPCTPLFSRQNLSLLRDDSVVENLALAEGGGTHGFSALVGLAYEETEETVRYRTLFAVETILGDDLVWSPLKYRAVDESELEDSRDIAAASSILHAVTKKPAKRMQKAVTGYLINGRKPWFNRAIGAPEDEDMVEGVKARLK